MGLTFQDDAIRDGIRRQCAIQTEQCVAEEMAAIHNLRVRREPPPSAEVERDIRLTFGQP